MDGCRHGDCRSVSDDTEQEEGRRRPRDAIKRSVQDELRWLHKQGSISAEQKWRSPGYGERLKLSKCLHRSEFPAFSSPGCAGFSSFQQDPAVALITGKGKKLFLFPLWRALFKDLQWEIPSKLQEIKLWREKLAARSSDGGEGG